MLLEAEQSADLFHLLCGKLIGEGCYRKVFSCNILPDCVVKQDTRANFSNISEYELWTELEKTSLAKWLAPVVWLSPGGLWLIQKRTQPIGALKLPTRIPSIFADDKAENWGVLNGRIVCHDYGNHSGYKIISNAWRQRPARWR